MSKFSIPVVDSDTDILILIDDICRDDSPDPLLDNSISDEVVTMMMIMMLMSMPPGDQQLRVPLAGAGVCAGAALGLGLLLRGQVPEVPAGGPRPRPRLHAAPGTRPPPPTARGRGQPQGPTHNKAS